MGRTPQGRTRHRKIPGSAKRHPSPGPSLRSGSSLSPLFQDQPRAYALPGVPRPRLVHLLRSGRGRMQGGHWHAPQTRRYALDRAGLQRHHRSPLYKTQWSFSRLLGAQIRMQGRMTHHFLGVRPKGCERVRRRELAGDYELEKFPQESKRETQVVSPRSPFGPLMSARRRVLSLRWTGRSRPMRLRVRVSSSESTLMISKYARLQRFGASSEGWTESALHWMKKGRRPWRSSARLTVFQVRTRPSGRFREPSSGPVKAILFSPSCLVTAATSGGWTAQPMRRGSRISRIWGKWTIFC